MRLFVGAVLQGLVSGCIIALLAAGVTIVYRSTRVLNFAQGSFATLSAYLYYQLVVGWGLPFLAAFPIVLVASALLGVGAEAIGIRPVERAESQVRAAGTIGLVLIVQWLVITVWGAQQRFVPAVSSAGISVGGVRLGAQHLLIVAATAVVGIGFGFALTRTRAGLSLAASAQDAVAAEVLGVSLRAVSMATFALAGVVGAIAGVLATPLLVLTPSQMTLVFVVSLGAALAGGFESLPVTVAAGLGLGVLQSLVTAYAPASSGLPQAAGFLAVLLTLAVVRRRVNLVDILRGTVASGLSRTGAALRARNRSGGLRRIVWPLAALAGVAAVSAGSGSAILAGRAGAFALALASLVVLTGWSGQLNLHVAAIGLGWGAYAAAGLASHGVPTLAAIVLAPVVVVPAALLVGVIAVRFRGLELAIATLAAGLAFEQMAFQSLGKWLGHTARGSAFESSLVSIARPAGFAGDRAYALLALGVAALWLGAVAWVGRGRSGRTLQVVRDREVVAEARGVPVFAWRVGTFALSIAVAAAGGALLAGQTGAVTPDSFSFTLSLQLLAVATLAGIRRLDGALIGAAIIVLAQEAGGIPALRLLSGDRADLVFGAGLIAVLAWHARKRATSAGAASASLVIPDSVERGARPAFAPTVLRIEGVRVSFGARAVLQGVDLRVGEGEVVGLVGGNGAGKTTLFDCITGLVSPDGGRVFLGATDITEMAPHRRAQRGLARTFQNVEVFGELTVQEGLLVATGLRDGASARDRVRAALHAVGIDDLASSDPATLPFAMRRLVEVASALVSEPSLVLLDEPLAGLDGAERAVVLAAIQRLRAGNRAVLMVEHDHAAVASVADRVYELSEGRAHERAIAAPPGPTPPRAPRSRKPSLRVRKPATPQSRTAKGARVAVRG